MYTKVILSLYIRTLSRDQTLPLHKYYRISGRISANNMEEKEFRFEDFTPEELQQFSEDYAVCDIETSAPKDRRKKREEFEVEYKKTYPLER